MIEKINTNQIRDSLEELSSRQPNSGGAVPNSDMDVSVQVNYASLIDQAMQASQTDADAVGAARKLLLSGRLESPKNFRAAAKNIIKFGI
ncbi:MAG TPA: hypothetical protein VMY06_02700 [Sedimentisphaerales bacterium]|nr:hypothetical protein [Sedimentisphaerales bacterium]